MSEVTFKVSIQADIPNGNLTEYIDALNWFLSTYKAPGQPQLINGTATKLLKPPPRW